MKKIGGLKRKSMAKIFSVMRIEFGEARVLHALATDIEKGQAGEIDASMREPFYAARRSQAGLNYLVAEGLVEALALSPAVFYLFPIALVAVIANAIHWAYQAIF